MNYSSLTSLPSLPAIATRLAFIAFCSGDNSNFCCCGTVLLKLVPFRILASRFSIELSFVDGCPFDTFCVGFADVVDVADVADDLKLGCGGTGGAGGPCNFSDILFVDDVFPKPNPVSKESKCFKYLDLTSLACFSPNSFLFNSCKILSIGTALEFKAFFSV